MVEHYLSSPAHRRGQGVHHTGSGPIERPYAPAGHRFIEYSVLYGVTSVNNRHFLKVTLTENMCTPKSLPPRYLTDTIRIHLCAGDGADIIGRSTYSGRGSAQGPALSR